MAPRLLLLSGLCLWAGLTLLLGAVPALARPRLAERLRPYAVGRRHAPRRGSGLGAGAAVVAATFGEFASRLIGSLDDVGTRLARIHSPLSVARFRMRQLGWAVAAVVGCLLILAGLRLPALYGVLSLPAVLLGAYAGTEARLNHLCSQWDRRRLLELPVVVEQLAMLMAAGYSLGSALARVSARGSGACALDLRIVCGRLRQGLDEHRALQEWAAVTRCRSIERLVAVLSLSGDTSDLGRLLAEESRSTRRQVQREAIELMDRRAQQVWIPVTVAALVPGVVFLAVPFVDALRVFAGA